MKHTARPWKVEYDNVFEGTHVIRMGEAIDNRVSNKRNLVVEYNHGFCPEDGEQFEEAEANAHLMTASPELLEALKVAFTAISDLDCGLTIDYSKVSEIVTKAIAKAEGKES